MAGYTREFLIDAYLWRFSTVDIETLLKLEEVANKTYDTYGKEKFRSYASLDAEYLRNYKANIKR